MGRDDFVDVPVMLIPKDFSLDIYKFILLENQYFTAFGNTLLLSASAAVIQTFICCLIAYGLAKFKFKGANLVFMAVILTMVVPHQTIQYSMFMNFRYFDIFGVIKFLSGNATVGEIGFLNDILSNINIFGAEPTSKFLKAVVEDGAFNLNNTYWPLIILLSSSPSPVLDLRTVCTYSCFVSSSWAYRTSLKNRHTSTVRVPVVPSCRSFCLCRCR